MVRIYRLVKDGEIVYVGKTKSTLKRRKQGSFYKMDREFSNSCEIELIEITDDVSRERYWIDYYTELGFNLLNRRGGDKKKKLTKTLSFVCNEKNLTEEQRLERNKKRMERYYNIEKPNLTEEQRLERNKKRMEKYYQNNLAD